MEGSSSTKEETAKGTPVYLPWSFHEVVRAVLHCLALEPEFHPNASCPKKDDDVEVNNSQATRCQEPLVASYEEDPHPSSSSSADYSDPPSTVTDPAADPPSTIARLLTSYIYLHEQAVAEDLRLINLSFQENGDMCGQHKVGNDIQERLSRCFDLSCSSFSLFACV